MARLSPLRGYVDGRLPGSHGFAVGYGPSPLRGFSGDDGWDKGDFGPFAH
jgi:hypothetical protein